MTYPTLTQSLLESHFEDPSPLCSVGDTLTEWPSLGRSLPSASHLDNGPDFLLNLNRITMRVDDSFYRKIKVPSLLKEKIK